METLNGSSVTTHFYPRPPRGGRRVGEGDNYLMIDISIHALREEGDDGDEVFYGFVFTFLSTPSARRATTCSGHTRMPRKEFLSTPSARRATFSGGVRCVQDSISIHALREEGDGCIVASAVTAHIFLSTPSARRATCHYFCCLQCNSISIHALREEGDIIHS